MALPVLRHINALQSQRLETNLSRGVIKSKKSSAVNTTLRRVESKPTNKPISNENGLIGIPKALWVGEFDYSRSQNNKGLLNHHMSLHNQVSNLNRQKSFVIVVRVQK